MFSTFEVRCPRGPARMSFHDPGRGRRGAATLLAALALGPLVAQGAVGPTLTGGVATVRGLNPPMVPATEVLQVQLVRLPNDPPGTWTAALSVRGLAAAWGGAGGRDLLIGQYDALADTFLPHPWAAACNTAGDEFGGMIDATGQNLVFLHDGRLFHARRPAAPLPFAAGMPVANLPAEPLVDPALGMSDGELALFYRFAGGRELRRSLFDATTSRLLGPSVVVQRSTRGGVLSSPTPLFGRSGEVTGLLHHDAVGLDSNMVLAADLDPNTPSVGVLDTAGELSHGSHAGGRIVSAEAVLAQPVQVVGASAVWMSSGEALIGQSAELMFYVTPSRTDVSVTLVLLAQRYATVGLRLPSFRGALGLDPASLLVTAPAGVHDAATGEARFALPVPPDPALFGLQIPAQGLTQTGGQPWTFTNTAALRVSRRLPPRLAVVPYDGTDHVLVQPVDPENSALTVKLAADAPLPIELLALDLAGLPLGEPVEIQPGSMNTIGESTAASYVARTPVGVGAAQLTLAPCDWMPYVRGPYCLSTTWWKQDLPAKRVCVQIQPQTKFGDSQCPVEWRIVSVFRDGSRFVQDSGTLDSATDLYVQRCAEPRAGASSLVLEFRCQGNHNSRCRVTLLVKPVADCADCPSERKAK